METFKKYSMRESQEYYHASKDGKIGNDKHPIWLSHDEHAAKGWHKNTQELSSNPSAVKTHKIKVHGKVADLQDEKTQKLLAKHNIDHSEYENHLASAQDSDEVHNHPGTKLLKKHGYVGVSHMDYDPHDMSKDSKTTVVFHRHDVSEK